MKHVHFKWKSPIRSGKKWHKTHPQPPIPSNRHPSSNWYGYPSSCNNKCEKVSYKKSVRMFAERLTSAAIIFFILLLILWLLHCVQIPFLHCAKTQALQVIDSLPVLLIALAFFTLLIFVCRHILLPQLPRENWKLVPKLTRILLPELIRKKLLSSLTRILLWKAAQRESPQNLTKILLSKPSREMVAESHQKCCYESCPERIAAEAHQNIAVKSVHRDCCQISTKYCCESCPEKKHGTIPGEAKLSRQQMESICQLVGKTKAVRSDSSWQQRLLNCS